ncbi:MAG: hypothetical protein IPL33_20600 [Sphingobacteriales bacterium]|nr:hypothetical protein [Sphingobacteriales bacterium]
MESLEKKIELSDQWLTYYYSINIRGSRFTPYLRVGVGEPYNYLEYAFVIPNNKSGAVKEIITKIDLLECTGESFVMANNDIQIEVFSDIVKYIGNFEGGFYSSTEYFKKLLRDWYEFLLKYESCQIPGIIPSSKLDTWSCVPNEYVRPEYWDLLKQQQEDAK